ncbi:hypothetical protein V7128_18470, partial [Neobacillus vireti]|uniref:hypothetical protein n=1 Tax=Neobacillus vireti TaxID=220686 RepID=UPI002FFE4346
GNKEVLREKKKEERGIPGQMFGIKPKSRGIQVGICGIVARVPAPSAGKILEKVIEKQGEEIKRFCTEK